MLGTRTKQVFSYGRRGHRIVSISDDHENDFASNNNRDPWRTPIVVKTKIHHHFPSESPSPQFVRVQNRASKKKRPSPSLSPASLKKKRTRVRQIVKGNVSAKSKTDATPRRPLSCHYPNVPGVPGSPVVRTKKNARVAGAKGTPLGNKMSKPFSPFMDMDIIVLDNDGKRISQERRVSRTDVVVNPPVREAAGDRVWKGILKKQHEPQVIVLSDSDDEQAAPKPPKRAGGRSKAIILSSDESEADEPIATPPKSKTKSRAQPAPKAKPVQRLQMEVVISPIKRVVKPKPKYWSPTPELPPTPLATKYVPVPIPQPRARQLTPIRRGASKALFRTYSPTPTNLTDLDTSLDFDFGDLTLSPSHAIQSIPPPEYLIPLLDECGQKTPHEFSAFIETFPFDPVVQPVDEDLDSPDDVQFRKIGEASYSEVFGIGNVVLKVIPLRDDTSASAPAPISDIETPFPSEAKDVLKEIIVTRAMGAVCEGFVTLLKTYIVRGKYPEILLALWDEYDDRKGSEGVRPDGFNVSQVYAIIVLPNGGPDLEAYTFAHPSKNGWRQACSLFWQVARTLARAEELVEFEHRDLHWGQILVKNTTSTTKLSPRRKVNTRIPMDDPSHGVETTIIDLGLARMDGGGGVHWTPFDEEIFEGEGDYQFDVYRMMRGSVGEEYRPITNVMWLHYLAFKLLHAKRLKPPGVPKKPTASSVYTERECYGALVEVEAVLGKCIKDLTKRKGKKTVADGTGGPLLKSAGDVVKFGTGKEWVR